MTYSMYLRSDEDGVRPSHMHWTATSWSMFLSDTRQLIDDAAMYDGCSRAEAFIDEMVRIETEFRERSCAASIKPRAFASVLIVALRYFTDDTPVCTFVHSDWQRRATCLLDWIDRNALPDSECYIV